MKITFVGAVEFSKHCLEIVKRYAEVQVLTRSNDGTHGDWAELEGIIIKDINKEAELIKEFNPDYIFVFGWSQIVGKEIMDIAPCMGSHPTLLPEGRGRHSLGHTLNRGLKKSGLTFFWMDEGVDTGNIIMQSGFRIDEDETLRSLYSKIKEAATIFLPTVLESLTAFSGVPQDESRASYWDKLSEETQVDYTDYFPAS